MLKPDNFDSPHEGQASAAPASSASPAPHAPRASVAPPEEAWSTTHARNLDQLTQWCDLAQAMEVIRGRWKPSIIVALAEQEHSVASLAQRLPQVDRRVVVRALRQLCCDGIAEQEGYHYRLSACGVALLPLLQGLAAWQAARD